MSKRAYLTYMIKRQGEDGEIGPYADALQVSSDSPLVELLKEKGYYEGAAEEWEEFRAEHHNPGAVAGDMDADGDYDFADAKKAEELNKVHEEE